MNTMTPPRGSVIGRAGTTLRGPAVAAFAVACGGSPGALFVGTDDDGGRARPEQDARADGGEPAGVLGRSQVEVAIVQRACTGACADVEAVAYGAYPPYTFTWEDGSTDPKRTICGTTETTYQVTARDTGSTVAEFEQAPTMATATPSHAVLSCASETDPGTPACDTPLAALPSEITPPLTGELAFFADGADLPAGRYVVEYVDGCLRFDPSIYFWTVNGFVTFEWLLVQDDVKNMLDVAPGVSSLLGYLAFDDCIAANRGVPPLDLDFTGGKLGIYTNDFKTDDNLPGADGRSPRWRLSQRCD